MNDGTPGKLDYYLHNEVHITEGECRSDGRRELKVRVVMNYQAPTEGLPFYVTSAEPGQPYLLRTNLLEDAYRVQLSADGRMQWVETTADGTIVHDEEPGTTFWRRLGVRLLSLLPIDRRLEIWRKLSHEWRLEGLDELTTTHGYRVTPPRRTGRDTGVAATAGTVSVPERAHRSGPPRARATADRREWPAPAR